MVERAEQRFQVGKDRRVVDRTCRPQRGSARFRESGSPQIEDELLFGGHDCVFPLAVSARRDPEDLFDRKSRSQPMIPTSMTP